MDDIQISLDEVREYAQKIKTVSSDIYELLVSMKDQMHVLDGVWISEGGSRIRERFDLFSKRFEEQKHVIDAYASFLDMAASNYESLEETIVNNAEEMQA